MALTYFFRDMDVLQGAVRLLVPLTSGRSRVRIWDAGCATGEEPYSLAMVLAEHMGEFAYRNLSIIATDIDENGAFRPVIEAGEYPSEAVERMPEVMKRKYFSTPGAGDVCRVDERVRKRVAFVRHDLRSLVPVREGFCMVMCKNVLLHLSPEERCGVFGMFHRALEPGGLLVMEQTQSLHGKAADLFARAAGGGQIYARFGK